MGREITNEFAVIREEYGQSLTVCCVYALTLPSYPSVYTTSSAACILTRAQKHTIVLAHGLLGFSELRLAGKFLPGLKYWRGITEALSAKGIEVIVATVPPSGSVEARAAKLVESISLRAKGKEVNIIAHSMGGLDSRYMISQLKPTDFNIKSLTTIATPHRGSAFADYMFETIGPRRIKRIYRVIEYFGFETGAFSQLTLKYMQESFNPRTPDVDGVRYFSYGASLEPTWWSVFAPSHAIIKRQEGINDGLVRYALTSTAAELN